MSVTHTKTYTIVRFANPYLECEQCKLRAAGYRSDDALILWPCGHRSGAHSVCPSWGPVDGCQCVEHLGRRDHGEPLMTG